MNQLLFPEWYTWKSVTWWKVKNEDILTELTTIRDERKKLDEENQKMIAQLQEYSIQIDQEKTIRAEEKIKQKYGTTIQTLKNQYATVENTLLGTENEEIEQKRKVLWEKLMQWIKVDLKQAEAEISQLEQQHREWKNNPDFKKRVSLVVQTKYRIGSIEHRLIEQWLFWLSDDDLTKLPEELAKQEQEGKKPEELVLSTVAKEEVDRITTYRTDRMIQINNTDKSKNELKQIADDMIETWEFRLEQKAWVTWGRFNLWWFSKVFGTTDFQIKNKENDWNDIFNEYEYDNKVLSKWKRHLTRLKAIKSNTTEDRKEPLQTQMKAREKQWIWYDHIGDMKTLIWIIQKEKWVSEKDALAIYMYLTWQYGRYRTWQIDKNGYRGCVYVGGSDRWFNSRDYDDFNASLLLSW